MLRTQWRRGAILAVLSAGLALAWGASVAAPVAAATARVELIATGDTNDVHRLLAALGAIVEVESGDRIQVRVPDAAVSTLRRADRLVRVEPPGVYVPLQALSAGALIGADRWLEGGLSGRGAKVAIVDTGFAGYEQALGTTLPPAVTTKSFRAGGAGVVGGGGSDHGLRAAEIVHAVAPGAELYLIDFSTVTEMSAAVDYLGEQQVDIVSFSLGYIHSGPGNGTGEVNRIVSRATDAGMAWAVASGNWAQQHWRGTFRDENRDAVNEFRAGVQQLTHAFNGGDLITLSLRWDDIWGAACADYDLELLAPSGALVRSSRDVQDCRGNPVESIQVLATESGAYAARVVRGNAVEARDLDVIFVGSPDRAAGISLPVPGGSLGAPADHPDVLSVGALTTALVRSEAPYSSRGPTVDGRAKPELLAPTGAGVGGEEAFAGTSAAAPHVAAAMALLHEAFPTADRVRLTAELRSRGAPLPAVEDGSSDARRLDLSSTAGIGPLLPPGSDRASLEGTLSGGAHLAVVTYHGPPDYPLRFLDLLMGERDVRGAWVFDRAAGRWRVFVSGMPTILDGVDRVSEGDQLVVVLP